jgi:peptide/nickel transport system ATP-binding protein
MMNLLEVQNLSIGIKRGTGYKFAVDDISFTVGAGEIVGLVGESGCGKSLTALSILRLLSPGVAISGGAISFEGKNLGELSAGELRQIRGKEISMIFQEPGSSLNPLLKIGRQIAETLELHGEKDKEKINAQVLDIMEKLGLSEPERLLNAYPHQLSGGMCQRVMIAIAAICRPKLIIADEPTTALDPGIQTQILDLLGKINSDFGSAILFISHDLSLVRRFCSRLLVMYAGKIVEAGSTETVFLQPAHPYTRGLIGSIPSRERRGRPLANISGRVPSIDDKWYGCPFAPRCPEAGFACFAQFPPKAALGGGHSVHCILAESAAESAIGREAGSSPLGARND